MNPIAVAVKHLMAAGVTGDALVTFIDEMEQASKPEKSKGALRTAKWREKKLQAKAVTEASPNVTSDVKKEIPHTPLEKTNHHSEPTNAREAAEKPERVSRGTRLPPDFAPIPAILLDARNRGLDALEIGDQIERFRDWANAATGQVSIKRDWQAALRNWLRRCADEKKNRNARPNHFTNRPTNGAAMRNALADNRRLAEERERQAGYGHPHGAGNGGDAGGSASDSGSWEGPTLDLHAD